MTTRKEGRRTNKSVVRSGTGRNECSKNKERNTHLRLRLGWVGTSGAGARLVNDVSMCRERGAYSRYRAKNMGSKIAPPKRKEYTDRKDESRGSIRKHWDKGSGL
jgi:hypothetical protein